MNVSDLYSKRSTFRRHWSWFSETGVRQPLNWSVTLIVNHSWQWTVSQSQTARVPVRWVFQPCQAFTDKTQCLNMFSVPPWLRLAAAFSLLFAPECQVSASPLTLLLLRRCRRTSLTWRVAFFRSSHRAKAAAGLNGHLSQSLCQSCLWRWKNSPPGGAVWLQFETLTSVQQAAQRRR